MIISFEGLDGVGKSSVSERFSKEYNFKRIDRPLYEVFGISDNTPEKYKVACDLENRVYNGTNCSELKCCLTSLGLIYIQKVLKEENIVIDRALISNFSYNGNESTMPMFEAMIKMGIYPDLVFLLYASDKTRTERIKTRDINDPDLTDNDVLSQNYKKIFDFLEKYNLPYYLINTENKNKEEVYLEVKTAYEEVIKENGNIKSRRKFKSYK